MVEVNSQKLSKLINDIKDGVDKSCFGPMFQYPDKTDFTKRQVNQLALAVFTVALTQILRNGKE